MTNYEKYQKQIINILKEGNCIAVKYGKPVDCSSIRCGKCDIFREKRDCNCKAKLGEWLESEYVEPTVDWSKVPVDTLVLAKYRGESNFRYFAGLNSEGKPTVYQYGATSKTNGKCAPYVPYEIKLYKEEVDE